MSEPVHLPLAAVAPLPGPRRRHRHLHVGLVLVAVRSVLAGMTDVPSASSAWATTFPS